MVGVVGLKRGRAPHPQQSLWRGEGTVPEVGVSGLGQRWELGVCVRAGVLPGPGSPAGSPPEPPCSQDRAGPPEPRDAQMASTRRTQGAPGAAVRGASPADSPGSGFWEGTRSC